MYSQLTSPIPSVKADGEPPSDDSAADDELARLRVEHLSSIDNVAIVRELGADASAGICNTVERLAAHLVVVGTHGRTGLRRFLIGSVAEKVVRLAPCAVMVVPTKMSRNESSVTPTNRCSSAGA
jgi:nucleotide-binding universal stress UspA family protein